MRPAPAQEPVSIAARAGGELLVARIRLVVLLLLFVVQLATPGADPLERDLGLGATGLALALALVVLWAVRSRYRRWLGFVSSGMDVTLVTASLLAYVAMGRPHVTVNSKTIFEVYFLAIMCASLRYDRRVCMVTGALAVTQYAAAVGYTAARFALNDASYAPFRYGVFTWNVQVVRIALLAAATVASTAVVARAEGLRRLSALDRLTSLLNRGAFDERLGEEASRAARHQRPLTLALVDIDHFKRFNDTHGHMAGDAALVRVAETLRDSVRQSDVVARFGGEEFGLILPETRAEDALERLEQIRRAVAACSRGPADPPGVTVSIGVASWPAAGAEIDAVLAEADRRLYAAKRAGRNRVVGPARSRAGSGPAGT